MEQRKSDINTEGGNVINVDNNGLNYSFDFSSQVIPNTGQVIQPAEPTPKANVDSGVNLEPKVSVQMASSGSSQPVVSPIPEVQESTEAVKMPGVVTDGAKPVIGPQVNVSEVTPMATPSVDSKVAGDSTVSVNVTNDQANVGTAPVKNVQDEVQNTEQAQSGDEEIIKDKKSTKVFLFAIVAIIVVFIIALPFIRNILG